MWKKRPPEGLQPRVLCMIVCDVLFARVHLCLTGAGRIQRTRNIISLGPHTLNDSLIMLTRVVI
jgi:hypothetical protein